MKWMKRLALIAPLCGVLEPCQGAALRTLPDLTSVTVWEVTFGTTPNTFAANSTELTTRIPGVLTGSSRDFSYYPEEYYDVFYSDAAGVPDVDGAFITVEGVWRTYIGLGGMNIAEVQLNFGGATPQSDFADYVASYVYGSVTAGGAAQFTSGSELTAVDHNLSSFPRFGSTSGANPSERFRLTVGFSGISDLPSPVFDSGTSSWFLLPAVLLGVVRTRRGVMTAG